MKYTLFIFLLLIFTVASRAQWQPEWTYLNGPNVGEVNDLKLSSNGDVYVTCENGLFKTSDFGRTWEQVIKLRFLNKMDISNSSNKCVLKRNIYDLNDCLVLLINNLDDKDYEILTSRFKNYVPLDIGYDKNNLLYILYKNDSSAIIDVSKDNGSSWQIYCDTIQGMGDFSVLNMKIFNNDFISLAGFDINNGQKVFFLYYKKLGSNYWYKIINVPSLIYDWNILNDSTIIIGTLKGLLYTTNFGLSWTETQIHDLVWDILFEDSENVYVTTTFGIYHFSMTDFAITEIFRNDFLKFLIKKGNTFMAAGTKYIYSSTDNGQNWEIASNGFTSANIRDIAFDKYGNVYTAAYLGGLFKSTDKGLSWTDITPYDNKYVIAVECNEKGYIYTSTNMSNHEHIFRSKDGGATWDTLTSKTDIPHINTSLLSLSNGDLLVNSGFSAVSYTTDDGDTWNTVSSSSTMRRFAVNSEGHIFGGENWGIISRSNDNGRNWERIQEDIGLGGDIYSFAFHPANSIGITGSKNVAYITYDNGRSWNENNKMPTGLGSAVDSLGNFYICWGKVYMSSDNCASWTKLDSGLFHDHYTYMEVSPEGYIYLGTSYGGLYRSRERYVSVKEDKPKAETAIFSVPNPSSGSTEIHYTCTAPSEVNISIRDILGREYATLSAGYKQPGSHSQHFDTSSLPPGIYFILIESVGYRSVGKMIVE